jgi:HD superfamily phosphohydrolase
MDNYNIRRIADPVHTSIGLSKLELDIINAPSFQRLRNVKQLGLAYLVFPGADYSRFSHSIGVCHVTGKILNALVENCPNVEITPSEIQNYRLAGLLHDVGHYPFSHTTEHAIANFYKGRMFSDDDHLDNVSDDDFEYLTHEQVGKEILENDSYIRSLLTNANILPEDIYSIFLRERPIRFSNMISSDLDADRIDYLLRTAHHTGLPYGNIDLPYLLTQLRVDSNERICLTEKGIRTGEHFLLSRYFDYSQVAFHKTVAALELVLSDVVSLLLEKGIIRFTRSNIKSHIESGTWPSVDDGVILSYIAKLSADDSDPIAQKLADSIVLRRPPKLVWETSYLGDRSKKNDFDFKKRILREKKSAIAAKFNIPEKFIWVWDKPGITLTKIGSRISVGSINELGEADKDKYEQSIRICDNGGESTEIMNKNNSLMSIVSDQALYSLRMYILFDELSIGSRREVELYVRNQMS